MQYLTTFITALLSTLLFPWLENKVGLVLTPDQKVGLTAALVGGATSLAHYAHSTIQAKKDDNGPVIKAKAHWLATVFAVLVGLAAMAFVLGGCATTPTANQTTGITIATELATGAAIEYQLDDPGAKTVRAQLFENGAKAIQKINDAGTLTLPLLAQQLQPLIAKLPPVDQTAANTLVLAIKPWVDQQLTNPKVANAQASIDVFLSAVIAACSVYTGS